MLKLFAPVSWVRVAELSTTSLSQGMSARRSITSATPGVLGAVPESVSVETPEGAGVGAGVDTVLPLPSVVVTGAVGAARDAAVYGAVIWMLVRNEFVGMIRAKSFSARSQFMRFAVSDRASERRPETAVWAALTAST